LVWSLHRGDARLDRALQLFERTHLNLAYSLARYAELVGQLFQRDRSVG
jgi:exonuclease VII small subunit